VGGIRLNSVYWVGCGAATAPGLSSGVLVYGAMPYSREMLE